MSKEQNITISKPSNLEQIGINGRRSFGYADVDWNQTLNEKTDFKKYVNRYCNGTSIEAFKEYESANDGYDMDCSYMTMHIFGTILDMDVHVQDRYKYELRDKSGNIYRADTFVGPRSILEPIFQKNYAQLVKNNQEVGTRQYNDLKINYLLSDILSGEINLKEGLESQLKTSLELIHSIGNFVLYPWEPMSKSGMSINQAKGGYQSDSAYHYLNKVRDILQSTEKIKPASQLEKNIIKYYRKKGISWEQYVKDNYLNDSFVDENGEVRIEIKSDELDDKTLENINAAITIRGQLILEEYLKKSKNSY